MIAESTTRSPSPVESAPTDVRAVLVGDSVALSLFAAYQPGLVPGLTVLPGTEFGCGLVPYDAALNGAKMPITEQCRQWEQQRSQRIAGSGANLGCPVRRALGAVRQVDRRACPLHRPSVESRDCRRLCPGAG
ncbi:MAG: hypothetical protein V9G10_06270 [Candidatus Nanopelagicales bacterium]